MVNSLVSYGLGISLGNKPKTNDDPCNEKQISKIPYLQYFIIFLVLIFVMVFKYTGLYENTEFIKERRAWGLFMEPIYYGLESLFRKFTSK